MRAVAKGDVLFRISAGDIEAVGVDEHGGIAVRGAIIHDHLLALGNPLAFHFGIAGRGAPHVDDRGYHPRDLVHRIGQQAAVGLQLRLFARVFGEQLHGAGDRVARRVVAREHDQQPRPVQIGIRQRLAFNHRIGDRAHQVGLRIGAALGQHVPAVFEHLADILVEQLDERRDLRAEFAAAGDLLGLFGGDLLRHFEEVDPADEALAILQRHAQHLAQGEDRQALREFLHQVAFAQRRHGIEQPRDFRRHPLA